MSAAPTIRRGDERDAKRLLTVWLEAVRATHTFLTEDDIDFYLPLVRDIALPTLETWVVLGDDAVIAGFMALDGNKVEALFIAPEAHGKGFGTALLARAFALKGPLSVDVNEDNPKARVYYRRRGFTETGRSERDGAGKPFPLIHMACPRLIV